MAGLGAFGGAGLGSTLMGMGGASQALVTPPSGAIGPATAATPSTLSTLGAGAKSAMANPGAFGSQLVSNLGGPLGAGAAGLGMVAGFDAASQPNVAQPTVSAEGSSYEGPYLAPERQPRFPGADRETTSEFDFFGPQSNPVPGYRTFAEGGMAEGFQTFGGRPATENLYAFDPDDARFRNELEKVRILGRQTSAGIPMNVSGIDQRGEPIYETTYNIPQITETDMGVARDALGITDLQDQIGQIQPLTFRDMTDQDMDYLKSVLDIRPSPETVVNPPSPSAPPEFRAPATTAPPPAAPATGTGSTAEKIYDEVKPPPPPPPKPPAPKPPPAPAESGYSPLEQKMIETKAAGGDPFPFQMMGGTAFEDAMFGGGPTPPPGTSVVPLTRQETQAAATAQQRQQPLPERRVTFDGGSTDQWGNPVQTTLPLSEFNRLYPQGLPQTDSSLGFAGVHAAASGGIIRKAAGGLAALAAGGELLEDGSFVIDARTVAELGNGSSNAGMELLMQLGGRPVQGPGDGVSDSVPAMIEGGQPAAVARDEVIFDPEAVARIGDGDPETGAQRLYELMRMAEDARKEVDRGEDSEVAAGLGSLASPEQMTQMGQIEQMSQMAPMGV